MIRELIIEGQHIDLADSTSITLEYVSNVLTGGSGTIKLSKSYTIKVPKTSHNARILDDPGTPAHSSTRVRRFLSARYYHNGIDLLGPAQAYVLTASSDSYELALIWNALPELQALSESTKTLNDVEGLPVLTWVGSSGAPTYGAESGGAFFARYDSGLGGRTFPTIPTATHPAMGALPLIDKILTSAGVPYQISSERVRTALEELCILAAPSHRPNAEMEEASGCSCTNVRVGTSASQGVFLAFDVARAGWDAPATGSNVPGTVVVAGAKRVHLSFKLRAAANASISSGACVIVQGSDKTELARVDFVKNEQGAYDAIAELELEAPQWTGLILTSQGVPVNTTFTTAASGYTPLTFWRVHQTIDIENDNRFPIAENLPNLKQWEFVKACMVLAGAIPVIQSGKLIITGYDEAFSTDDAYDWSDKVAKEESVEPRLADWARENIIRYKDDDSQKLSFDPSAIIYTNDETVAQSRDLYQLPFAASQNSIVPHYIENKDGELEDINIKPRILVRRDNYLVFPEGISGNGLIQTQYRELQETVQAPVLLTLEIRLHELDLAAIDMRRAVYLRQYGRFYNIIKVQASDSGAKVELIQIP